MKNFKNKILFKPRTVALLAIATVSSGLAFQNCSQGTLQGGGGSGSTASASSAQVATKAASMAARRDIERSIMNVTGLTLSQITLGSTGGVNGSDTVRDNVLAGVQSVADPTQVSGPSMMAVANLSALHCIDVITQEQAKVQAGTKPLFTGPVNMWLAASTISDTQIQQVANNFARSFWGRDLHSDSTNNEVGTILASMSSTFASSRTPATAPPATLPNPATAKPDPNTSQMMYFLCAAMLASAQTHVR